MHADHPADAIELLAGPPAIACVGAGSLVIPVSNEDALHLYTCPQSTPAIAIHAPIACNVVLRGSTVLILRKAKDGSWDIPKGRGEAGESLQVTARRELREEIGIDERHSRVLGAPRALWYRSSPTKAMRLAVGQPVEVGRSAIRLSTEHTASTWCHVLALPSDMPDHLQALVYLAAVDAGAIAPTSARHALADIPGYAG